MRPARDEADFLRAPIGAFLAARTSLVWCHSATLCGTTAWGRPSEDETRATLRLFDGAARLAPRFDLLLDGSAIEKVEPPSLLVVLEWTRAHLDELQQRVRARVGVIADGLPSVTLSGISPTLGGPGPLTLVREARLAFRRLLPDGGDALCDEVARLVESARGLSPLLIRLRPLLDAEEGRLPLADAARALGLSVRSLQRELQAAGLSYREEQQAARFRIAEELLAGDAKLSAVAERVGLSAASLARLVRAKSGLTPGSLRRRLH